MTQPAPAADAYEIRDPVWIEMRDGTRLAARIWLPRSAHEAPVPAVLEYLPYRRRDGTLPRDELHHAWFARNGYAGVRVDIRGNGDSDGIMEDEYTATELDDGVQVIEWLARQGWCSGAVGMIGISWGGFNGLQLAELAPEPLKAAVTICFTDDRYADDIHYMGGSMLTENIGWSSQMLAYSSRPPDPAIVGDRWREMWRDRLEHQPLHLDTWLRHQRRDAYWRHGSVCENWGAVKPAILAVGGWADAYSNAVPRTLAGMQAPAKGLVGPWAHRYPNAAYPEPRIGFLTECRQWFDHWLKGIDTGAANIPAYRFFIMDSMKPSRRIDTRPGRWASEPQWPSPRLATWQLALSQAGLGDAPGTGTRTIGGPQTLGARGQRFCPGLRDLYEMADDQTDDDAAGLSLDTAPLEEGIDIVGAAELALRATPDAPTGFVVARLCDLRPDGSSAFITMGVLNLTHRFGHDRVDPMTPGQPVEAVLRLNDIAYHLPRGHRLRLSLSTSYWPMIWPSPAPLSLALDTTATRLSVPLRPAMDEPAPQFGPPEDTREGAATPLRPEASERIEETLADGTRRLRIVTDGGRERQDSTGIEAGRHVDERWEIHRDDPLSARMEVRWTCEIGRGDWQTRTETQTEVTCDATHFHVRAWLRAHEGGRPFVSRDWAFRVPRDGI
jgi:putative CocE/NonD family hydrolase